MFKEILKKSLVITWRSPVLWIFGFFSSLFFIFSNEILLFFLIVGGIFRLLREDFLSLSLKATEAPAAENIHFFMVFLLIVSIFFLFLIFVFSEIFLIFSLKEIDQKKIFIFKDSWQTAKRNILPVLFFHLIGLFLFGFFWLAAGFFSYQLGEIFLFFTIILFLLIVPIIFFIIRYAIFYLIIEKKSLNEAIKFGFFLFKKKWLKTLCLALILFLIIIFFSLFSLFSLILLLYPLRLGTLFFTNLLGEYGFWLMFVLMTILILSLQIIFTGFINTYQINCWVLFFLRIKSGNFVDKQIKLKRE